MVTTLTRQELIDKLKLKTGELVTTETQVGFNLKNSALYYYFKEEKGVMVSDYIYNQRDGSKLDSFRRFWNFFHS